MSESGTRFVVRTHILFKISKRGALIDIDSVDRESNTGKLQCNLQNKSFCFSHIFSLSLTLIFFLFLTLSLWHAFNCFLSYTPFPFFRSLSYTSFLYLSLPYTLFLAFSLLHTFLSFFIVNIVTVRLTLQVFSRRHSFADP